MSEARLLIFLGVSMEDSWGDPGGDGVDDMYPTVLFAVRPVLGMASNRWISPHADDDRDKAEWYKVVAPPEASDLLDYRQITAPEGFEFTEDMVRLNLGVRGPPRVAFSLLIDHKGDEVASSRIISDGYRIAAEAGDVPVPDVVTLADPSLPSVGRDENYGPRDRPEAPAQKTGG
jgi:hypothetical protein